MKPIIAVLAIITFVAHIWLSNRQHAGPNEIILMESVQEGLSDEHIDVSVEYEFLDGYLEGRVPTIAAREAAEEKALELRLAGRIINNLKVSTEPLPKRDSRIAAKLADRRLVLTGLVPNRQISSQIEAAAKRSRAGTVDNQLEVDRQATSPKWFDSIDEFMPTFFKGAKSAELIATKDDFQVNRDPMTDDQKTDILALGNQLELPLQPSAGFIVSAPSESNGTPESNRTSKANGNPEAFSFVLNRTNAPFEFQCVHCKQQLSATEDYIGRDISCPNCSKGFTVPGLETRGFKLDGWLPATSMKTKIVNGLKGRFPKAKINDNLQVDPKVSMPEWGNRLPDFVGSIDDWNGIDGFGFNQEGMVVGNVPEPKKAGFSNLIRSKFGRNFPVRNQSTRRQQTQQDSAATNVLAVAQNGYLTLSGRVPSNDLKLAIERSAKNSQPKLRISNDLQVDSSIPANNRDRNIASLLGDFLSANADYSEFEINSSELRMKQSLTSQSLKNTYSSMAKSLFPDIELVDEMVVEPKRNKSATKPSRSARLKAFFSAKRVQLDGEVPDRNSKANVVNGATNAYPQAQVRDNIEVSPEVIPAPWLKDFGKFIGDFKDLAKEGEITIGKDEVGISGTATGQANHNQLLAKLSKFMPKDIQIQDQMKPGSPVPGSPAQPDYPSYVVYYATGSSQINNPGKLQVTEAVRTSREMRELAAVLVKGFADSRGNPEANKRLSEKRAQGVVDSLMTQGVDPAVIRYIGVGESESQGGDSQNDRRVEIILVQ